MITPPPPPPQPLLHRLCHGVRRRRVKQAAATGGVEGVSNNYDSPNLRGFMPMTTMMTMTMVTQQPTDILLTNILTLPHNILLTSYSYAILQLVLISLLTSSPTNHHLLSPYSPPLPPPY